MRPPIRIFVSQAERRRSEREGAASVSSTWMESRPPDLRGRMSSFGLWNPNPGTFVEWVFNGVRGWLVSDLRKGVAGVAVGRSSSTADDCRRVARFFIASSTKPRIVA